MRNLPDWEKKTRYLATRWGLPRPLRKGYVFFADRVQKRSGEAEPRRQVDTAFYGKAEPYRNDAAKPRTTG